MAANKREQELQEEIDRLRAENGELKTESEQRKAESEQLKAENEQLKAENETLRAALNAKADAKSSKKPAFGKNYSLGNNSATMTGRRRRKKRKKKSPGRRPRSEKADRVTHVENVYPPDVPKRRCILHGQQFAWRLIDGQAVYVQYNLYAPPNAKSLPTPPGLRTRRSEFGIEIIVAAAYLHYWIGISIDKVRDVMSFFTGLELSKSQADSLLSQLARDWKEEYETIAALLALQVVIYVDETGWRVGKKSCYTWAFSSAMYVFFRCGVGRGKGEAQAVLGDVFDGIGVSDDYAAYQSLFREHQLCWAHLLRKAIKLTLQYPDDEQHAKFLHELYQIYSQAVAYQKDRRLTVGRAAKVEELKRAIRKLCCFRDLAVEDEMPEDVQTMVRLHHELIDHLDCLFVFVLHPEVEPTNNGSERTVRREAEVRKGGRTSKSAKGARRRSIIMTVFASLRTRMSTFTLTAVLAEIHRWLAAGRSVFQEELATLDRSSIQPRAAPT